jgi:hypothetical protein
MQTQAAMPIGPNGSVDDFNGLYRMYLQFLQEAQDEVRRRMPDGFERDAQLKYCEPLPLEHFEAKIESARAEPERFERIVRSLVNGYPS